MGKTTTIGKLAHRLRVEGNQTVLLAACDTFRAGAVEQLEQWALRAGVDVVGPDERATTPAAVLYRALDRAVRDQRDVLLVDTSGRLSNNDALTMELAKMKRVIQKRLSVATDEATGQPVPNLDVPHETLLVLDAAQGRMALDSARVWNREIGLTGLILTKLDGSARGGSVVAVSRDLQLPVKLIGVGEGMDDLRDVRVFDNGWSGWWNENSSCSLRPSFSGRHVASLTHTPLCLCCTVRAGALCGQFVGDRTGRWQGDVHVVGIGEGRGPDAGRPVGRYATRARFSCEGTSGGAGRWRHVRGIPATASCIDHNHSCSHSFPTIRTRQAQPAQEQQEEAQGALAR